MRNTIFIRFRDDVDLSYEPEEGVPGYVSWFLNSSIDPDLDEAWALSTNAQLMQTWQIGAIGMPQHPTDGKIEIDIDGYQPKTVIVNGQEYTQGTPVPPPETEDWRVMTPLNFRPDPTTTSLPYDILVRNTLVAHDGKTETADGYDWLHVQPHGDDRWGWVARGPAGATDGLYLIKVGEAPPPPPPPTERPPLTGHVEIAERWIGNQNLAFLKWDGQARPRQGMNFRALVMYGTERYWNLSEQECRIALGKFGANSPDGLTGIGGDLVRYYASYVDVPQDVLIERNRTVNRWIGEHAMHSMVVATDSLHGHYAHNVTADLPYHKGPGGHLVIDYFRNHAYREHYLPWVVLLARSLKGTTVPVILQLFNEPAVYQPAGTSKPISTVESEAFVDAIAEIAQAVKEANPDLALSVGLINTRHIRPDGVNPYDFARGVYTHWQASGIDIVSAHVYPADKVPEPTPARPWPLFDDALVDISAGRHLGMPVVIDEVGVYADSRAYTPRLAQYRFFEKNLGREAKTDLIWWAHIFTNQDKDQLDRERGIDPLYNPAYYNIVESQVDYQSWLEAL